METEAMMMVMMVLHCDALTSAMQVRLDILSSIGRTSLWRKLNSAFWQAVCRHCSRRSCRHRGGELRARGRRSDPPPFACQVQEMSLLPQSNIRFVIFE
jgi:hypothetical protein